MDSTWAPHSWTTKPCQQAIDYSDAKDLNKMVSKLSQSAPLVTFDEIEKLKAQLASAHQQACFFLQAGDCAELFTETSPEIIQLKSEFLLNLAAVLGRELNLPIVTIGRIAGQYAKARTELHEQHLGASLPSYRGDLINAAEWSQARRQSDANRLWQAYECASLSLRALAPEIYTSHEALNLYYEEALTRQGPNRQWYNTSTHFPWLGLRTSALTGAHVEYLRGIANPIAVKIGPGMTSEHLQALILRLNPERELGKLCLLTRLGAAQVALELPRLIDAVRSTGVPVLWGVDPMHGNTKMTRTGFKTRDFDMILTELQQTISIHAMHNSHCSGIHLELTHEAVTECVGGPGGVTEHDLIKNYKTPVDPRLNGQQAEALVGQVSLMKNRAVQCTTF
jgi:3-deoxy-7-phosphoheptulonate synthase